MNSPTVSILICAYTTDRWSDLCSAIESVLTGSVTPKEIVVVIDHNDVLLQRVRGYAPGRGPDAEPAMLVIPNTERQGLSGARNTGIEAASGDILAFLDDDATADPDWLEVLLTHYHDADVIGVGGLARPVWPAGTHGDVRPHLLPSIGTDSRGELDWIVGCTYEGQPTVAQPVRNLMGCNMSFRSSVFERVGGFSEHLGRIGKTPLGCEETEFCVRARNDDPGARIVFEPAAGVSHRVTAERVRWRYLVGRCYAEGISKAAVSQMVGRDAALSSEKAYASRVLPKAVGRQALRGLRGNFAAFSGMAAVVVALSATVLGFARGSVALRLHPAAIDTSQRGRSKLAQRP